MVWWIWLIIIGGILFLLAGGLISMLAVTTPIGKKVYFDQLVRTSEEKWGTACSAPENEEQLSMWNTGCAWAAQHQDVMQEVDITHDGLHLHGELYRFGGNKCVIILPGRCECLKYSYYFAAPYEKAGFNVLVIDSRAHGQSDGKYNTVGIKESRDVLAWARYLEQQWQMESIWLHAICIGSSAAALAMAAPDCPTTIHGMVAEGMFVSFRECFKRHMMDLNRPRFPVLDLTMRNMNRYGGVNVYKDTPLRHIANVKQKALFLFGEQDIFSIPPKSRMLVDRCGSPDKKLVWFPKGGHSHLRINDPEGYDRAILDYLKQHGELESTAAAR